VIVLFSRNRVADFDTWKRVFDAELEAGRDAGLRLTNLWRDVDDPNNVFFIFEVADIDRAKSFLGRPESVEAGERAGVLDGEYYFLENQDIA
jgi:hypothetical protein